jgi:SAM-dependent methyltransferase
MPEWFADESFWIDLYPFTFSEERLGLGEAEVTKILALAGIAAPEGRTALDLCCGPGRHAVPLARRGMRVTGVDRTRFLLDRAQERGRLAGVSIELVEADMRDFQRPAAYDLALSMFTSFGYFESRDDDLRVLRNVRASLTAHGVFVIDVMGKEWLARHFQPTRSRSLPDGSLLIERNTVVDDWTAVESQVILLRDGPPRALRSRVSVYSGLELRDRLLQASFATVRLHGGLDGTPYDLAATRLVAVARAEA